MRRLRKVSTGAGPGRTLRWGVLLLALAGIGALLLAGPASADPAAKPQPSTSAGPSAAMTDKPKGSGETAKKKDKEEAKKEKSKEQMRKGFAKRVKKYQEDHGKGVGVLSAFQTTDEYGIPLDAYEVVLDDGGATDFQMKMQAFLIEGMFSVTKWLVAFACWMIAWALSWSLAAILLKPALAVSDALYNQAVLQLGVPSLLLTFSGVLAIWHLFFGQRSRGWGEIVASTLISALAASSFLAPPQMLLSGHDGAVGKARELGLVVSAIVLDKESALPHSGRVDSTALTRPITDKLVDTFVVQPSMLLSYAQSFHGKCAQIYSQSRVDQAVFDQAVDKAKKKTLDALARGQEKPEWGQRIDDFVFGKAVDAVLDQVVDKEPGEAFEKDCVKGDAGEAKKSDWDKVGGAAFVLFAAILVCFLFLALACGYLVLQAVAAYEATLARVALVAGIMPGPGRAWLWQRAVSVLRVLGMLVALVVALAAFIVAITAILNAKSADIPGGLTVRFVVVDLLVIGGYVFRKRLAGKSKALAGELRSRMGNSRFGGRAPAQLDQGGGRRSMVSKIATTGLMLGALAATGGGAATFGASHGARGALGVRLAARGVRAGGRAAVGGTAATARAVGKVGKFGIKYTVGAPIHAPRAARAAAASVRAIPGQAQSLRSRLHDAYAQHGPGVRDFAGEYWNNVGGRWATNLIRMHRGLPPLPPRPSSGAGSGGPAARRGGGFPAAGTRPAAPGRTSPPRPRPVPPRVAAPPASAQQAALQRRLHRARTRTAPPPPAPGPRPGPSPTRRAGGLGGGGRSGGRGFRS